MKILKSTLVVFILFLISINLSNAQEVIMKKDFNEVIRKYIKNHPEERNKMKSIINDTISLPFFDDFSAGNSVYPDQTKWRDKCVFINDGMAIDPPTVGVATFDGINQYGFPYFLTSLEYTADTLTSQFINLDSTTFSTDTTVFLSFFYQSSGNGNAPDDGDSLVLQFKYYDDSLAAYNWATVWEANGQSLATPFQQVFVQINDTLLNYTDTFHLDKLTFFTNNFQFRFMNLASGYGDIDVWNLDYVYLDKNRSPHDTTILDIAFVNEPPSFLKNYQQMPWTHYCVDTIAEMVTQYPLTIRNNDILSHLVCYTTTVDSLGTIIYTYPFNTSSCFLIDTLSDKTDTSQIINGNPANFYFRPNNFDWAQFNIKHFLTETSGDINTNNDTLRYLQRFTDYYAYDDGTAEEGYGTWGYGAELAMQFKTTKADTLRGVYMFFNQMVNDVHLDLFALTIWSDIQVNNSGSTVLHSMIDQSPMYDTGMEAFHYYVLDTPQFIPKGTFYVGWIQDPSYEDLLNIGLDMNTNWDSTRLFYNSNGTWYPSELPGTVMIRPVFGASATITGIQKNDNSLANSVDIYPNPANNAIYLKWTSKDHIPDNDLITEIYDPAGRLILTQTGYRNEINISSVSEGFYFVKMSDKNSNSSFIRKLVISR